jgi:carboxypeptidase C (cathepsin A)
VNRLSILMSVVMTVSAVGGVAGETAAPDSANLIPDPQEFVTRHSGVFNGVTVAYEARAGEAYLRDEDGEPKASVFSFAYTKVDPVHPTTRPVIFIWNGGPGSASLWLHMGTFGPRRVSVPSNAENVGAPPYELVDNPLTLLDICDLVFVDPVGTGYSRPLGGHEGGEFWGLNEDAESIADFIRLWLTENGRWNSPKFLAGESFGTVRAAAVAELLEVELGISLNGIVLISQALDYAGSTPVDDNLISYITYLPTMAAVAAYHGKANPPEGDLEAFLDEARAFAADELAPALIKGSALPDDERAQIRDQLAYFTGLDPVYIERADLRVTAPRFRKELLREEGLSVGRSDGRYTRDDLDDTADRPDGDASSEGFKNAFVATLNQYLFDDLDVRMDRAYKPSAKLWKEWNWRPVPADQPWEPRYVDVARRLSNALRANTHLKVLVASGYYDMATPFFDAEFTFRRHAILRERVEFTYYRAGHMMYVHAPSLEAFMADVRRFVLGAAS